MNRKNVQAFILYTLIHLAFIDTVTLDLLSARSWGLPGLILYRRGNVWRSQVLRAALQVYKEHPAVFRQNKTVYMLTLSRLSQQFGSKAFPLLFCLLWVQPGFLVASLLSPLALALTGAYRETSLLIYTPSSFGFLLLLCQVVRAGSALCEKFYSRSKVGFKRRKGRRRVRRRKGMLWHLQPSCTDAYLSCFELSLKLLNSRTGTLFFFFFF